MENWKESLKNETFADDAINYHRDEIISRAVKLPDDAAIRGYVMDMFARKVKFIQRECGEPDFDGQEFQHTEQRWFDRVKVMLTQPHLMDVSAYATLEVRSDMLDGYVNEKMTFDGNGIAKTKVGGLTFDLTDAIVADMADFKQMNDGVDPNDRHYIKKVWFAGLRVEGQYARVLYTVIEDGRCASGKLRKLRKDAKTRTFKLCDMWQAETETNVAW